jgi:hypothetical protein
MVNKRLPADERKNSVNIRLPQWMINEIIKRGSKQEVIEGILRKEIKKPQKKQIE